MEAPRPAGGDDTLAKVVKSVDRALGIPYVWGGGASPERRRSNEFRPRRRVIVNMTETDEGDGGA